MTMRYSAQRGYQIETGPNGVVRESDTSTCQHCNRPYEIKPMCDPADAGGLCKLCMGLICGRCVDLGGCDPFEKKLQRVEAAARAREDTSRFNREVEAAFSRLR